MDRDSKVTLSLTIPRRLFKSSTNQERVLVATFSSPPTDHDDCVVFVYVKNLQRSSKAAVGVDYEIRTWRVGQVKVRWNRHPITVVNIDQQIISTAYVNGILYLYFQSGRLLAFNSANGDYQLLFPQLDNVVTHYKSLVVFNAELLLLRFTLTRLDRSAPCKRESFHVYGYDVSTWVRKPRLTDQVAFVSSFWYAMMVPVPAREMRICFCKAYGRSLVTDGVIKEIGADGSLLDHDLCCVSANVLQNTGENYDYVWLSYPFFD